MSRYDPSYDSNVLVAKSARLREEQHRIADERREVSDFTNFQVANSSYSGRPLGGAGSGHILIGSLRLTLSVGGGRGAAIGPTLAG